MNKFQDIFENYQRRIASGDISEAAATTEFDAFMKSGVKTLLLNGYGNEPIDYEAAVTFETSNKLVEDYPMFSAPLDDGNGPWYVGEGEEPPKAGYIQDNAQIRNRKKAYMVELTHELIRFDQTGAIKRLVAENGRLMRRWENAQVAAGYNTSHTTTCYDGQPWCDISGGHPNVTGGSANTANVNGASYGAVTQTNIEAVMTSIAGWKGLAGEDINVTPTGLVCSTSQVANAMRAMNSPYMSGGANQELNYVKGMLKVIPFKALTADTWYVTTSIPGLVWQTADKLAVMRENPNAGLSFSNMLLRYLCYEIVGFGCVNWRWAFKGN